MALFLLQQIRNFPLTNTYIPKTDHSIPKNNTVFPAINTRLLFTVFAANGTSCYTVITVDRENKNRKQKEITNGKNMQ